MWTSHHPICEILDQFVSELHLLAEGEVVASHHHCFDQLTDLCLDLDRVNCRIQMTNIPSKIKAISNHRHNITHGLEIQKKLLLIRSKCQRHFQANTGKKRRRRKTKYLTTANISDSMLVMPRWSFGCSALFSRMFFIMKMTFSMNIVFVSVTIAFNSRQWIHKFTEQTFTRNQNQIKH